MPPWAIPRSSRCCCQVVNSLRSWQPKATWSRPGRSSVKVSPGWTDGCSCRPRSVPPTGNTVWWKPPSVGSSSTGSAPSSRRYQGRLTSRSVTVTATWPIAGNSGMVVSSVGDRECEDIGSGVVAGGVEGAAAGRDQVEVEGGGDLTGGADQGPGEHVTTRGDDRGVAPREVVVVAAVDQVGPRELPGDVAAAQEGRDTDDEDPALACDVAQRRDPVVAVVPGGCEQHVDAPLVERRPSQWHVVLPADQRPDPHTTDVHDRQHRPLAVRMDEAFRAGGDQLAVQARDAPGVIEVDHGVVQGPGGAAFGDPERDPHAGSLGSGTGHVQSGAGEIHGLVREPGVPVRVTPGVLAPEPVWVPGHERLREDDQFRSIGTGLRDVMGDERERGGPVEVGRRRLDGGDRERPPSAHRATSTAWLRPAPGGVIPRAGRRSSGPDRWRSAIIYWPFARSGVILEAPDLAVAPPDAVWRCATSLEAAWDPPREPGSSAAPSPCAGSRRRWPRHRPADPPRCCSAAKPASARPRCSGPHSTRARALASSSVGAPAGTGRALRASGRGHRRSAVSFGRSDPRPRWPPWAATVRSWPHWCASWGRRPPHPATGPTSIGSCCSTSPSAGWRHWRRIGPSCSSSTTSSGRMPPRSTCSTTSWPPL